MPRNKLLKPFIVKHRLYTAIHLLDSICQDTAVHDGPDPQPVIAATNLWLSSKTGTAHRNAESGPSNT